MEKESLKGALEALLFITDKPLKINDLKEILEVEASEVMILLSELRADYAVRQGMQILEVAEGYQMGTRQEHGAYVRRLYKDRTTFRLSQAALETLAIVAYRQPITRAEIEEVRGVDVIAPLETLLERRLIKVIGRKEALGRPLLYGSTIEFLRQFGLASLEQLPPLDSFIQEAEANAPAAAAEAASAQAETQEPAPPPPPPPLLEESSEPAQAEPGESFEHAAAPAEKQGGEE